jgi:hypothetical protein
VKLTFFCTLFSVSILTSQAWGQEGRVQEPLFDNWGIPRYSAPEGDLAVFTGPFGQNASADFFAPQLYIDGKTVLPGAEFLLETGESFVFRELLGAGFHTIVIRDMDNRVIRLARHIDVRTMEMHLHFMEAALLLSSVVDPRHIVQLGPDPFRSHYVTSVELLAIEMTLDEYLDQQPRQGDPRYQQLLEFFDAFHRVRRLGNDFLPKQIGYVANRGWVLFDFGAGVEILRPKDPSNRPLNLINHWSMQAEVIGLDMTTLERLEDDIRRRDFPPQIRPRFSHQTPPLQCRRVFAID